MQSTSLQPPQRQGRRSVEQRQWPDNRVARHRERRIRTIRSTPPPSSPLAGTCRRRRSTNKSGRIGPASCVCSPKLNAATPSCAAAAAARTSSRLQQAYSSRKKREVGQWPGALGEMKRWRIRSRRGVRRSPNCAGSRMSTTPKRSWFRS